jgi:O-antigen biosynthesis protein
VVGGPTGRIQVHCCLTVANRSGACRADARSWLAGIHGAALLEKGSRRGVRLPDPRANRYDDGVMHFHPLSTSDIRPPPWTPKLVDKQSDWWGHVPFAFWVTQASRPRILVELGTHHGVSYAAFCEAVTRSVLATRCYAVDSWIDDDRAGVFGDEVYKNLKIFHDENYARFSELVRSDFDSACGHFADASIDLLHIDGLHTYEAARHDFETWRPKLTDRGIVLVHCTNVRADGFGVWRFFDEASKSFPNFEFLHSYGLGVLAIGPEAPEAVKRLCELSKDADVASIREVFSNSGSPWVRVNEARAERDNLKKTLAAMQSQNEAQRAANADGLERIALLQNEQNALRAALDTSERLVAYVSERYRSAVRKRKLRSLKRRLWLAVRKLPVRRQAYEVVSDSSLFEKHFYLSSNPDVRASGIDPIIHYLISGSKEGRSPSPFFSEAEYRKRHPDAAASGLSAVEHFESNDGAENRRQGGPDRENRIVYETKMRQLFVEANQRPPNAAIVDTNLYSPLISILLPTYNTPTEFLETAIKSVDQQIYQNWELCIVDDGSTSGLVAPILNRCARRDFRIRVEFSPTNGGIIKASQKALEMAKGDFVALLDHDDMLAPTALSSIVDILRSDKAADIIYTDHINIFENGEPMNLALKPGWSPEFFLATNYIVHFKIFRRSLLSLVNGFNDTDQYFQDAGMMLKLYERGAKFVHCPKILYFWRVHKSSVASGANAKPEIGLNARKTYNDYFRRNDIPVETTWPLRWRKANIGAYQLKFSEAVTRPTSIVVPVFDKNFVAGRLLQSLLSRPPGSLVSIHIIHLGNGVAQDDQEAPRDLGVAYHTAADQAEFDHIVTQTEGDLLVFVSEGSRFVSPSWLAELVGYFGVSPEIAVVGGKILDRSLNVVDGRRVLSPQLISPPAPRLDSDEGYWFQGQLASNAEVVSSRLMATTLSAYKELGGVPVFTHLGDAGAPYCLKAKRAGYRTVFNPSSKIVDSRPFNGANNLYLKLMEEFGESLLNDRYYNPAFSSKRLYDLR